MMKFKKLGLFAILGLGLFSLASCGGSNNEADPSGEPTGQNEGEGQGSEGQGGSGQQGGGQTPATPTITNSTNGVEISLVSGAQESIYAEYSPVTNATSYNVYYKESTDSSFSKADNQLTRLYKENNNYFVRTDIVGLKAGTYEMKIVPVINDTDGTITSISGTAGMRIMSDNFGLVTESNGVTNVILLDK